MKQVTSKLIYLQYSFVWVYYYYRGWEEWQAFKQTINSNESFLLNNDCIKSMSYCNSMLIIVKIIPINRNLKLNFHCNQGLHQEILLLR